jgi:serine/threonine-protein kinase SRPK3
MLTHLPSFPRSENRHSALKVVKSAGRYAETARDEIKLLRQVMAANPTHPGRNHIVAFLDSFTHSPSSLQPYGSVSQSSATNPDVHICIVFEPLGENLLALIERHKSKGVPLPLVKVITKQMLSGLQYLHDECELVHTDIKPENISTYLCSVPA